MEKYPLWAPKAIFYVLQILTLEENWSWAPESQNDCVKEILYEVSQGETHQENLGLIQSHDG